VPIGIMIEVAAAAQSDVLARHADFFSIGTNDLTQYVLAIDRQNPELAAEADSLHPAVLRAIRTTVEGARRMGAGWASAAAWPAIRSAHCCWPGWAWTNCR
jgi:phosphocarrier protein FPr